jgi:hypothetical protein
MFRRQHVVEFSSYQGTTKIFRSAIFRNCPWLILCHKHLSGDPTPQPRESCQLPRWLIGIDEDGIFINPALLVRAEAVVATASNRPEVTKMTCHTLACRPSSRIL